MPSLGNLHVKVTVEVVRKGIRGRTCPHFCRDWDDLYVCPWDPEPRCCCLCRFTPRAWLDCWRGFLQYKWMCTRAAYKAAAHWMNGRPRG